MSERLQHLKNELRKLAGFSDPADAIPKGLCVSCGRPALENCYSDAGRREYRISGLCEKCFDAITAES